MSLKVASEFLKYFIHDQFFVNLKFLFLPQVLAFCIAAH